jgi:hypothetical protein
MPNDSPTFKKNKLHDDSNINKNANSMIATFFRYTFDIGKKLIDIIDDIWFMLRGILPPYIVTLIGTYLTGFVTWLTHTMEAYDGGKDAYLAYQILKESEHVTPLDKDHFKVNEFKKARVRVVVGSSILITGLTGSGLAISLIAGAAGASISGALVIPIVVPALLTFIYILSLIKNSYLLYYENLLSEQDAFKKNNIEEYKTLKQLDKKLQNINKQPCANTLSLFCKEWETNRLTEEINISPYKAAYAGYRAIKQARFLAKRQVAFNLIEVLGSLLVLAATILGAASLVGAIGATSFGLLPLALGLLVMGVVIGISFKISDKIDEKNDYYFSKKIAKSFRAFFKSQKEVKKQPIESSTCNIAKRVGYLPDSNSQQQPFQKNFSTTSPLSTFYSHPNTQTPNHPSVTNLATATFGRK